MSKRNWWLLTLASSICLCAGLAATILTLNLIGVNLTDAPALPPATALPTAALAEPTAATPEETSAAETPSPEPSTLSAEVRTQMDEIQQQVILLRGLAPTGPVQRALLTPDELRQRVIDELLETYSQEEADDDAHFLALLGLLPAGFDLWTFSTDLYAEQLAGYYDHETKEMYVVAGQTFAGPERLTYAHEYVHALQDQNYDIENGLGVNEAACDQDSERCAAIRSLMEGDASLVESEWLRLFATPDDLHDIQAFYGSFEGPVFYSAPESLQNDFLFPYTYGIEFVRQLYLAGGWAAVDRAYTNPPTSTEQILHPERFPEDAPIILQLPDALEALGPGWRPISQGVMGEWTTRLVLLTTLEEATAIQAAEGWGGAAYVAFTHEPSGEEALIWLSQWDRLRDSEEAFLAFRGYGDQRFGDHASAAAFSVNWNKADVYALLERQSEQVLWIQAADVATALTLRQAVDFPTTMP